MPVALHEPSLGAALTAAHAGSAHNHFLRPRSYQPDVAGMTGVTGLKVTLFKDRRGKEGLQVHPVPAVSQPSQTVHPSPSNGTEAQAGAPFRSTPETVASNTPPETWLTASICSQVIAARWIFIRPNCTRT